jgi:prevent-host-death family protein
MKYVSAAEFKAKCLKLMDEVQATGEAITVTKRGKPVVTVKPSEDKAKPRQLFGAMKGTFTVHGDIESPLDPDWEAEWGKKWDRLGFPVIEGP